MGTIQLFRCLDCEAVLEREDLDPRDLCPTCGSEVEGIDSLKEGCRRADSRIEGVDPIDILEL